jgi:hypothetical protein
MLNKFESLNSSKMDLGNVVGGMSQEAAAAANNQEWLTRTNVVFGPTSGTSASQSYNPNSDPFGDLSLDSNTPQGG